MKNPFIEMAIMAAAMAAASTPSTTCSISGVRTEAAMAG